jgi:hypothetical protein
MSHDNDCGPKWQYNGLLILGIFQNTWKSSKFFDLCSPRVELKKCLQDWSASMERLLGIEHLQSNKYSSSALQGASMNVTDSNTV